MNRDITAGLVWAGATVGLALAATLARRLGYVDGDTVTRVVIGFNGIMIAWYGNRLPKAVAPSVHAARLARAVGWALTLSGIVYTLLWAFAPIQSAVWGGCAAIGIAGAIAFGYICSARAKTG